MKEREDDRPRVRPDPLDHLLATSTMTVPPRPALKLPVQVGRSFGSRWWLAAVLGVLLLAFAAPRSWLVPPEAALLVWTAVHPVVLMTAVALWSAVLGTAAAFLGSALGNAGPPAGTPFTRRSLSGRHQ